jgi:hypothetical protein
LCNHLGPSTLTHVEQKGAATRIENTITEKMISAALMSLIDAPEFDLFTVSRDIPHKAAYSISHMKISNNHLTS